MRTWWLAIAAMAMLSFNSTASGADYKTLRHLNAPPPTQVSPLPTDAKVRPVQFARIVVHPQDGEPWAVLYTSIMVRAEGDTTPAYKMVTWRAGAENEDTPSFARVFDDELKKAGFKGQSGESLFDDNSGSADLKIGVLIDDLQGRFCVDCPNLFNRDGIPASVVMTAHWEVYSSLDRRVIAKITTSGGADYKTKLEGRSFFPAVLEGFRENVRQLLASTEFRQVVTTSVGAPPRSEAPAVTPISLIGPKARGAVADASKSVAIVLAADGHGSGFLVSEDGYLITNQHVVGGSQYVKLKWSDNSTTLGEVIRVDSRRDVALIKTDPKGRPPLAIRLGPVRQGEPVFAIGTPLYLELQNTMTKGIISAERTERGLRFIQSDVAVNHGNSGGPLLDEKGAVIGLTESVIEPNGDPISLNFFIPIDDALKALGLNPPA